MSHGFNWGAPRVDHGSWAWRPGDGRGVQGHNRPEDIVDRNEAPGGEDVLQHVQGRQCVPNQRLRGEPQFVHDTTRNRCLVAQQACVAESPRPRTTLHNFNYNSTDDSSQIREGQKAALHTYRCFLHRHRKSRLELGEHMRVAWLQRPSHTGWNQEAEKVLPMQCLPNSPSHVRFVCIAGKYDLSLLAERLQRPSQK